MSMQGSEPASNTFDRTAGSHSLAAAGQRERYMKLYIANESFGVAHT